MFQHLNLSKKVSFDDEFVENACFTEKSASPPNSSFMQQSRECYDEFAKNLTEADSDFFMLDQNTGLNGKAFTAYQAYVSSKAFVDAPKPNIAYRCSAKGIQNLEKNMQFMVTVDKYLEMEMRSKELSQFIPSNNIIQKNWS